MPSFILYSFADFGATDNSFVTTPGTTMILQAAATPDTLHIAVDDDPYLDKDATGDLDQVLTSDLYLDGVKVGSVGDLVSVSGTTLARWELSPGIAGSAALTSISINGVPVGYAMDTPNGYTVDGGIPPGLEIAQFINVGVIPIQYDTLKCFTKGTMIAGAAGEHPVESLKLGDLVQTRGHGMQPVRWVYKHTVPGWADLAPINIRAGVLGNTKDLLVSPMHRVMIEGHKADILFGIPAVLVHAKDQCDGQRIVPQPCAEITYYHILFDRHELVFSNGCWSESFAATAEAMDSMEAAVQQELRQIFPHLAQGWQDALPTLNAAETALLALYA